MSGKRYKRASELYESGELDKALKECEKGISENLKEASLLNLKGIILYQRGNLEEAIITWNINREFNDDQLSKTYLNDSRKDKERKKLYDCGEKLLKELNIDEAIKIFNECKKSSFNAIKVNTALALCYLKKGMHDECRYYALEALKIDKNYNSARNIINDIDGVNNRGTRLIPKLIISIILLFISVGGTMALFNKFVTVGAPSKEMIDKKDGINKENDNSEKEQNIEEKTLDISLLKHTISEKDVDKVYGLIKNVDKTKVKNDDLFVIEEAEVLLENEGVEIFYSVGREAMKSKDFNKANEEFKKSYEYGKNHYLYPHIVYFMGNTLEELEYKNDSTTFYEEYITNYKDGDYREEALYKLAILNKVIDKNKSVKYAKELNKKYPKSIYNNNLIKEIVES
ncbi:MAG: hypothetical protein ACRC7N_07280 [Clostridium sp.]